MICTLGTTKTSHYSVGYHCT